MEEKNVLTKKIPTLLGVFLLLGGLVAGLLLVGKGQFFSIKAGPTAVPKSVKVANLGSSNLTITWITDTPVIGLVKYSDNPARLNLPAGDNRDQQSGTSGSFTTHFVDLVGLTPGKTYYFEIVSGSQTYDDNGKPYQVATASQAGSPTEDVILGKVIYPSGQAAGGVIVFVEINGAEPLAALTKDDGGWRLTLSAARDKKGQYVSYDPQTAPVSIFAQGGNIGTATAVTDTGNDSPVADIILGKTQNLLEGQPTETIIDETTPGASESGFNNLSAVMATELEPPSEATLSVKIENVSYNGEKIATSSPEFRGKAPEGTVIKITVHSAVAQMGTVTVDENGEWAFTPPEDLEPGEHTMTVEYTDENGVLQTLSRTFTILAAADAEGLPAFTATPSATTTPIATRSSMPATASTEIAAPGTLTPTLVLSILGLGLFFLGIIWKNKLAKIEI